MTPIRYRNRVSGAIETEQIYGAQALNLIYGDDFISKLIGPPLLHTLIKRPFFSRAYGWWQQQPWTKKKIVPFIEGYGLDVTEFKKSVDTFTSFNDFFIRELKPDCRSLPSDPSAAILPADGRYLAFQHTGSHTPICVKGIELSLSQFLGSRALAENYIDGSLVLARLAPPDYHRYHFPVTGTVRKTEDIPGHLYSVNPWALQKRPTIFQENRRTLTLIESPLFGTVAMVEIGATCVGSIIQTFTPDASCERGQEKGYFAFGGSAIALLFEPGKIQLDEDLLENSRHGLETLGLFGQQLGMKP